MCFDGVDIYGQTHMNGCVTKSDAACQSEPCGRIRLLSIYENCITHYGGSMIIL